MENKNKFTQLNQVGIVVRDLEHYKEMMRKVFGVEPDALLETKKGGKYYRGKETDYTAKIAFYRFSNIEFEVIQPNEGECAQNEWLERTGAFKGIHHLCFNVDSYDEANEQMRQHGCEILQNGQSAQDGRMRWAYYDTEEALGFDIEIINKAEFSKG